MSTSKIDKILHKGFGIKNIILKSLDFLEDTAIFRCKLKKSLRKCSCCGSQRVEIKETKVRSLRLISLGALKTYLEITVHKFSALALNLS